MPKDRVAAPERLYVAVPRESLFDYLDGGLEPATLFARKKDARRRFATENPGAKRPALLRALAWEAAREGVGFAPVEGGWAPDRALAPHLLGCRDGRALRKLGVRRKESAGGIVVSSFEDPRVLLLYRRKGDETAWKTPKGGIGRKETRKRAARREVREESGIERVRVAGYLGPIQYFKREEDGSRREKTVHLYLMVSRDGEREIAPREGEHFVSCEWLEFEDAAARVTQPQARGAILRAREAVRALGA